MSKAVKLVLGELLCFVERRKPEKPSIAPPEQPLLVETPESVETFFSNYFDSHPLSQFEKRLQDSKQLEGQQLL